MCKMSTRQTDGCVIMMFRLEWRGGMRRKMRPLFSHAWKSTRITREMHKSCLNECQFTIYSGHWSIWLAPHWCVLKSYKNFVLKKKNRNFKLFTKILSLHCPQPFNNTYWIQNIMHMSYELLLWCLLSFWPMVTFSFRCVEKSSGNMLQNFLF